MYVGRINCLDILLFTFVVRFVLTINTLENPRFDVQNVRASERNESVYNVYQSHETVTLCVCLHLLIDVLS